MSCIMMSISSSFPFLSSSCLSRVMSTALIPNINTSHADNKNPLAIVMFGPTAVGKTDIVEYCATQHALKSAQSPLTGRLEVISADSRQIYKDCPIATAMPSVSLCERVPHHLVAEKSFDESYTVFEFVHRTHTLIKEIRERGNIPLIVGGTAYYLYHLCVGVPSTPKIDMKIRTSLHAQWQVQGQEAMYKRLKTLDAYYARTISSTDAYRTLRGLEVLEQTGMPLSTFSSLSDTALSNNVLVLGLTRERANLYNRINNRVESMLDAGLADEVYGIWRKGISQSHNLSRTIGLQEFLCNKVVQQAWMQNNSIPSDELEKIIALIQRNSRRYAKRQYTFFQKLARIYKVQWWNLDEESNVLAHIWDYIHSAYRDVERRGTM